MRGHHQVMDNCSSKLNRVQVGKVLACKNKDLVAKDVSSVLFAQGDEIVGHKLSQKQGQAALGDIEIRRELSIAYSVLVGTNRL